MDFLSKCIIFMQNVLFNNVFVSSREILPGKPYERLQIVHMRMRHIVNKHTILDMLHKIFR